MEGHGPVHSRPAMPHCHMSLYRVEGTSMPRGMASRRGVSSLRIALRAHLQGEGMANLGEGMA